MELIKFCNEENLVISDRVCLPTNTYTYYSEAHNSSSWLDHVLCTNSAHSLIKGIHVCYDYVTSDHVPLCVDIMIESDIYT